jgi:hypothetical protein
MATAIEVVTTATMVMTAAATNKEIHYHQPSFPATASRCQVTQMLLSTFVVVAMARVVAVAVPVVMALAWRWQYRWCWQWRWQGKGECW